MSDESSVLAECPDCNAVVAATVVGELNGWAEEYGTDVRYELLKCPRCSRPLLVETIVFAEGNELLPSRIYPPQKRGLSYQIPEAIRSSFDEARRCLDAGCFTAAAIMCRKSIEEIARLQGAKAKTLLAGLKELRDKDQIDQRLFEWADLLRSIGNAAAHGVGEKIPRQDAEDALHFTEALADYVYVLKARFEDLEARRRDT